MSLRPLYLPDDLPQIENLVRQLYGDPYWGVGGEDIDDLLGFLSFLRTLWKPIAMVRWLFRGLQDTLLGYVWENEREIVGVAIYDRVLGSTDWRMTLLAVRPGFRGRGIATRLVDAVIRTVQKRDGLRMLLEVSGESESAIELFHRMGFETYDGMVEFDYAALNPPTAASLPEDYSVFPLNYYSSRPRYELAQRLHPSVLRLYEPLTRQDFERTRLTWGLRRAWLLAKGIRETELCIRTILDGEVVARGGIAIRSRWGDISEIAMRVDPNHAKVLPYLFHRLVSDAQRLGRRRRIELNVPIWQEHVIEYAREHDFQQLSTYYKMGMMLGAATSIRSPYALKD